MWKTQLAIAGFEDGRVVWAKESRWLEAGKETNKNKPESCLEHPERNTALLTHWL